MAIQPKLTPLVGGSASLEKFRVRNPWRNRFTAADNTVQVVDPGPRRKCSASAGAQHVGCFIGPKTKAFDILVEKNSENTIKKG